MSVYSEKDYSLPRALENIGAGFWSMYKDILKIYAEDRSRTDNIELCQMGIEFIPISVYNDLCKEVLP